jgi:hypothetical protein
VALKDIQMNIQGTVGKRQHVTSTMHHKIETIRRHESGES